MNLFDAINLELPDFSGLVIREGESDINRVKSSGVSMAWKMNQFRARNMNKVLIINSKLEYLIADLTDALTIRQLLKKENFQELIKYQEEIYGTWITDAIETNNLYILEDRCAVLFENPTEVKTLKTNFTFNRTSIYYIYSQNNFTENLGEYINIENFGKIESAKVKLNGLTVIAGTNDTGKSTVGKVLFSLVKGVSRFKQDLKESREHKVSELISELYNNLRKELDFNLIIKLFHLKYFFGNIRLDTTEEITAELKEDIENLFDYKELFLKENLKENNKYETYLIKLRNIKDKIYEEEDKKEQIQRALDKVLFSEFMSDVSPKVNKKKTLIKYFAGINELINIEIEKNKVNNFQYFDDLTYKDVVFIETPLIIQQLKLIGKSDVIYDDSNNNRFEPFTSNERSRIALHIKDLANKIEAAQDFNHNLFYENDFDSLEIIKTIKEIINGGFAFNKTTNDLEFINSKKEKFQAVNTASGIKSFGIIQLLLQANVINTKSLLIIDEPENHLHPEWQLKYAEMIIELVKANIPVVITSHSPYMIKALQHFSEKENCQDNSAFYFVEKNDKTPQTILKEVTSNLNVIYTSLAEPFTNLVWK
jgi:predicted ATPase